jgi:hypothetical protein
MIPPEDGRMALDRNIGALFAPVSRIAAIVTRAMRLSVLLSCANKQWSL